MAVSRIGGSSGKLTGQVGSDVYQIRKNADGTYTQIVYQKGQRVETTFTPKLQAQRMCMGMVESLMKQLKPVVSISYQSGKSKTASANAFSSTNVMLVMRDCQDHWYDNNVFVFAYQRKGYPDFTELGGRYMISSGTLSFNLFDRVLFDEFPKYRWDGIPRIDDQLYGLYFDCRIGQETLEQFRKRHRMTILDGMCWVGFREWIVTVDPDEGGELYTKHDYIIVSWNSSIPSSTILTRQVIADLFKFKTNANVDIVFKKDNSAFAIGRITDFGNEDEQYFYQTGFSISYITGKKQISTSIYTPVGDPSLGPYMLNRQPSMVFGSWMGQPMVRPYPSPF